MVVWVACTFPLRLVCGAQQPVAANLMPSMWACYDLYHQHHHPLHWHHFFYHHHSSSCALICFNPNRMMQDKSPSLSLRLLSKLQSLWTLITFAISTINSKIAGILWRQKVCREWLLIKTD